MRVLATPLRWHRGCRALEDLQERLLHAFTGDVTGDRRVLTLAGDLVDLIDVDDAGFGLLHVVVGGLDELEEDVLDILADIARLGERRCIGNRERNVEHAGKGLGQERLARTGRAEEQDVRLGQLDLVILWPISGGGLHSLVVVVDRNRKGLLRGVLADHVFVEEVEDLARLGEIAQLDIGGLVQLLFDDLIAQVDALVADVHARARYELLDLLLTLAAEGTLQQVTALADPSHASPLPHPPLTGGSADRL